MISTARARRKNVIDGETMLVIDAPHFYAAVFFTGDVEDGSAVAHEAAPIVFYMRGWSLKQVEDYCSSKGWRVLLALPKHLR